MRTHCKKILAFARSKPVGHQFKVSDFTACCFTYEVGTRVGDLVRKGYLQKVGMDGRFAIYELSEEKVCCDCQKSWLERLISKFSK